MIYLYDLPEKLNTKSVAIDTETMGLCITRDRLCLIQICDDLGKTYLIHFKEPTFDRSPNLLALLKDENILKIFHYARFDVTVLMYTFKIFIKNIFCTKIASRLSRTYTNKHSLKELCKEILNIELNKDEQTSYWGSDSLNEKQINYARNDVLYLHSLKDKLLQMNQKENRTDLLNACNTFLPFRAQMDILAGENFDVFPYKNQ